VKDNKIRRVVMCSGKVYYDLYEEREKRGINDVYLLRLEQLYPFPAKALINELSRFKQRRDGLVPGRAEEHGRLVVHRSLSGMGAGHIDAKHQRVRYTGRPASASTATGLMSRHLAQLEAFLEDALGE
jgi:2-oxoglutarate dehydrogenase E1 component